jgi:putative tricarboxylic transport membrane protein
MISFSNDWTVFFTRPIAGTVMAFVLLTLLLPVISTLRARRAAPASLPAPTPSTEQISP